MRSDATKSSAPLWVRCAAKLIPCLPAGRYRAMNWICHSSRLRFFAQAPVELGGWQFLCDLRDSISKEVCFTGRYEILETKLLQRLLRSGMNFIDVGANWGYFSLLASHRIGPTGRVLALEPDPRMFEVLQANITRNSIENIFAKQIAAADTIDTRSFLGFNESEGNFG